MRVFICLVTGDQALRSFFGLNKNLVPADAARRGFFKTSPASFRTGAWDPGKGSSSAALEKFLLANLTQADACILILDESLEHFAANIRNAVLATVVDIQTAGQNPQNFFRNKIAQALRALSQVLFKFEIGNDGKLLTLPLRNFDAAELREIVRLCREDYAAAAFGQQLDQQLDGLRRRVRPRRQSTYRTKYVVDDQSRFFVFGNERHSRMATGHPHQPFCQVAGQFRFGRRIDDERHYNVSETESDRTSISGNFRDCHDDMHIVGERTHLNMFANDYF